MDLRLHVLEAGGSLERWRSRMNTEAQAVSARIDALVDERDRQVSVDVIVRRAEWGIVPELGLSGSCYEPHLVTIAVMPECEAFEGCFEAGAFRMTLAHELHHALRHAACGYGETLGHALISEGLADHFACDATGCEPLIWTHGADLSTDVLRQAEGVLSSTNYDHEAWFFGHGNVPQWAGYAIGWQLVSAYLAADREASAASLVGTQGSVILSAAWPALMARRFLS